MWADRTGGVEPELRAVPGAPAEADTGAEIVPAPRSEPVSEVRARREARLVRCEERGVSAWRADPLLPLRGESSPTNTAWGGRGGGGTPP